jgi:lysophospholipase L1-like esterase
MANRNYIILEDKDGKEVLPVTDGNGVFVEGGTKKLENKLTEIDSKTTELNEQLDTKAKQSDLIVERKRIDNLTTLPKGSTMGDAELMDGRIGLGGKIFNNIGDAIRSQFGYINEKSNDLTFNYISGNNETSNLINYVSYYKKGYYVHSNGTENSNSDFAISELIPVTPLATCRFKILSDDATSIQHTGVILDKNGQYIQPLTKLDSITDITEKEIILPSNAYFVRVNLRIGFNKSYFKIVGTKELKWLRICKENLKDDVFFEKNLPWNGKKVTIYSDSLAQINDWAGNTLSWVSFLKEYCGFSEVVNKGIGGTTITPGTREGKTNDFYTRITTQNDIGTHLFIIFGGMNDYLFNSVIGSPNEAPGNTTLCNSVKSICEHIQTRYPESQILFILPPYGVPEPTTTNTIKEVSKAIEESVEDYGVEILNLTKYGDITVKNSAQKSLYYYDGIHYNDKGHERIAKNKIIPKVNSMLIRN